MSNNNNKNNNYGADSIKHLETREAIRTRVSMYLGSDDTDGTYQALKEIINNSTDEAIAGFGNEIQILLDEKTNEVTITDFGRGVPFSTANGRNVLVEVYTEAHTGGKFDKDTYKISAGLNGIGGTAVCMSSDYFVVETRRDEGCARAEFSKGILQSYEEFENTNSSHGTTIKFRPDKEVFINATENYSYERICSEIKNISFLNKGIRFVVESADGKKEQFYSENGIADFIKESVKSPLMSAPIFATAKDETDEVEIAFMWTNDSAKDFVFVNGLYCPEGGTPITGAKTKLTTKIKSLANKNLDSESIRHGLVFAVNCKVTSPSFANQTKSKINNPNLRTLTAQAFEEGLEQFSLSDEFATIVELMLRFQKAEMAAERARMAELNQNKEIEKELKKKIILMDKLVDCKKHDENSQILLCEGKSAKGALVKARSSENTACFELRGKLINTLKNDPERVNNNDEIRQLHVALGCGVGSKFNIKKLRYGRIVICADMDLDGYSIVCLVLTFFYTHYPELLKQGKVYWGVTPLFKVETKGKTYYAYNEEELKALPKGTITRFKGLGESIPKDFRDTIFSKDARMVKFTIEDAEAAKHYFDVLLGNNIEERKEYVFSHVDFENLED